MIVYWIITSSKDFWLQWSFFFGWCHSSSVADMFMTQVNNFPCSDNANQRVWRSGLDGRLSCWQVKIINLHLWRWSLDDFLKTNQIIILFKNIPQRWNFPLLLSPSTVVLVLKFVLFSQNRDLNAALTQIMYNSGSTVLAARRPVCSNLTSLITGICETTTVEFHDLL